jgi:hypothetical protein
LLKENDKHGGILVGFFMHFLVQISKRDECEMVVCPMDSPRGGYACLLLGPFRIYQIDRCIANRVISIEP